MDRWIFTQFGNSLLGFTAMGIAALGFVWPVGGASMPPAEGEWRLLEPVSYENLTLFPVVSSSGYDTSAFLTLEEGLSRGEVVVREQGAEVLVRNRGERDSTVRN
jgi:hypothetical protein